MTINYCARFTVVALLAVSMALCGCLGRSQPTRFYLLQALHRPDVTGGDTARRDLRIGVGPVTLPEYLDRPQIVTRISESELLIDEFNQWAESPTYSISRILAKNLSSLLATDNLFVFPWPGSTRVDYQVTVDVIQFNGVPGGKTVFETHYAILDGESRKILGKEILNYSRPTDSRNYEALVLSLSKTIEDLSREVAEKIKSLSK